MTQATESETKPKERTFKKPEGLPGQVNVKFIRPSELNETGFTGVVAQGIFEESIKNKFDESKLDYKIKQDDGSTVIINASGGLAYNMKSVAIGTYVRISYLGMKPMKGKNKNGKLAHQFEVLVAED